MTDREKLVELINEGVEIYSDGWQKQFGAAEAVADHLKQNSNHVLVIEGNTDERGSNEYNLSLGENRALSIRTELIMRGITEDRIQTRSFGEEKPAV